VPWLKLLHLTAVTLWCGALLYLPLALAASRNDERLAEQRVLRLLFTSVATPAALVAIASGTLIFLWQGPLAPWLVTKLAVVSLMVLLHASLGMLVLRSEAGNAPRRCYTCGAVFGGSVLALSATAWLVLAKPVVP
jgi:protoporphyrinogen IX oxidase